eukprot:jgi/Botrbrau1/17669/Bobra.0166s0095.1
MPEATMGVIYHPTKKLLGILCGMLTTSLALFIAALTGHSTGWFYFRKNDFHYFAFELFKHLKPKGRFDLQIWIGYVRGTNSIRQHLLTFTSGIPHWDWLFDEGAIGAVIGWTQAGFLIAGFFACIYLLIVFVKELVAARTSNTADKLSWPRFAPLKIIYPLCATYTALFFSITILFLVATILGSARKTLRELDYKCLVWPDWAWWLTIINAFIWIALCVLLRKERTKSRACVSAATADAAPTDSPV